MMMLQWENELGLSSASRDSRDIYTGIRARRELVLCCENLFTWISLWRGQNWYSEKKKYFNKVESFAAFDYFHDLHKFWLKLLGRCSSVCFEYGSVGEKMLLPRFSICTDSFMYIYIRIMLLWRPLLSRKLILEKVVFKHRLEPVW